MPFELVCIWFAVFLGKLVLEFVVGDNIFVKFFFFIFSGENVFAHKELVVFEDINRVKVVAEKIGVVGQIFFVRIFRRVGFVVKYGFFGYSPRLVAESEFSGACWNN